MYEIKGQLQLGDCGLQEEKTQSGYTIDYIYIIYLYDN